LPTVTGPWARAHALEKFALDEMTQDMLAVADLPQHLDIAAQHQANAIGRVALVKKVIVIEVTLQRHRGLQACFPLVRESHPKFIGACIHNAVTSHYPES
jgi:hypothetical protein